MRLLCVLLWTLFPVLNVYVFFFFHFFVLCFVFLGQTWSLSLVFLKMVLNWETEYKSLKSALYSREGGGEGVGV